MSFLRIHYFVTIAYFSIYGVRAFTEDEAFHQDIEIEQRLKILNKPAIKSIQLDYAIFDCVDIYKQPALDHPLLQNHKIQMQPPNSQSMSSPKPDNVSSTQQSIFQAFDGHLDRPIGTVPIRQTTKEDLQRQKLLKNVVTYPINTENSNDRFALMRIQQGKSKITGGKGSIDIQNPSVNDGESSGALIWFVSLTSDENKVEDEISAGWLVAPKLYGNSSTYFTAEWNGRGGGCINMLCPGFVQISQSSPLGFQINSVSKYGGPLYAMPVWIHQDNATKNWWLVTGTNKDSIGYWPKELFSTFDDGAQFMVYGGVVRSIPNQTMPPMGSGYTEECRIEHTSFFCKVEYETNNEGVYIPPISGKTIAPVKPRCTNYVVRYSCKDVKELGYYSLYGGPRGYCQ